MPFPGLHCTPESYPGFVLEIQHKEKFEGTKDIYTDSGGRKIFLKVTMK